MKIEKFENAIEIDGALLDSKILRYIKWLQFGNEGPDKCKAHDVDKVIANTVETISNTVFDLLDLQQEVDDVHSSAITCALRVLADYREEVQKFSAPCESLFLEKYHILERV